VLAADKAAAAAESQRRSLFGQFSYSLYWGRGINFYFTLRGEGSSYEDPSPLYMAGCIYISMKKKKKTGHIQVQVMTAKQRRKGKRGKGGK
jgi:hypothetical protein